MAQAQGKPVAKATNAKSAPAAKAPAAKSATTAKATVTNTGPQVQRNDTLLVIALGVIALLLIGLLITGIILGNKLISTPPSGGGTSAGGNAAVAPIVGYTCNAVAVGAPVKTDGQCSYCTINYQKPGDVFIVGENPVKYQAGAWVFQYPGGDADGFNACIQGQDFMSDQSYQPVWKK